MTVSNLNGVKNQFIINDVKKELSFKRNNLPCVGVYTGRIFQSYSSNIVFITSNDIFLDERFYNYSKTTSKYRNIFLNETSKEIENNIKSGKYILTNLN